MLCNSCISYHLWHISSAHTKPLISQTASPWTAVRFSCLGSMSLKSPSCLLLLTPGFLYLYRYFLIFASCHFWHSGCAQLSQNETFQPADVGKERNSYNNAVSKLALNSIRKKFHLSFHATCSPWTKLCISERRTHPGGLHKEMRARTAGCLLVQNERFLPLEMQILCGCSLPEFM